MSYDLGPKAQRIYDELGYKLQNGILEPGDKLPSHFELSVEYGVSHMTVRQVLAILEENGWVTRQQGRGTFVLKRAISSVMIVTNEPQTASLFSSYVRKNDYFPLILSSSVEALEALEKENSIALILSDIYIPEKAAGIEFIRTVRRRWPKIPLAVLTSYSDDLVDLYGTPEWPILILTKPLFSSQVEEILRLGLQQLVSSTRKFHL